MKDTHMNGGGSRCIEGWGLGIEADGYAIGGGSGDITPEWLVDK